MNKVIIGDAVLYHGDSIKILPELGECADMVFTDPPYLLTSGGNGDYVDWQISHDYDNTGAVVTCDIDWKDFMPLLFKSMRGDSHCYTMCNNRHVKEMIIQAEECGLRQHNLCVWDKGSCTPNRWYMKNIEFIGMFFKGKAKFINNCSSQQLIYCPQENYGGHPTTKPTALCEFYIRNSSNEGQTVLDPFMGVGSTGLAALKSGRKFIGIELEKKWFDKSVKRLEDFYNKPQQISMF